MFRNTCKLLVLGLLLFSCKVAYHPAITANRSLQVDSTISSNPQTEAMLAPYKNQLDGQMNRVIGKAPRNITKSDGEESALGNMVADLQLIKAAELTGKTIDLSVVGGGGLRVPMLSQGDITVGDIFELMPFDNELWVLTLKGETVAKLFKYMGNRKGLSVANTQVTFKNKEPEAILIAGKPFELSKTYTLAISDYMATGGDGMFFLSEATDIIKTNKKLRDVIISYIEDQTKSGKLIEAQIEGRVFIK
jgi:2',3'-cyclic-nucleotide 2'-phosphodiesterase (5'-nucleotidase family)